ncbi:zinc-binding dehydrogenase [Saccharopolyspora sp. NPDC047091]|uniref:quinone oxidoreductase family protein n=1 Tax=Saccharopolyspora sp. NPDC047091 TaxID=3155924 RepID=UPI0033C85576
MTRAVTIPEFGGPDVLRHAEVEPPRPGPGEIALDVECSGVNYAEVLFRQGLVDVPLPYVPGIEAAGRVRELGPGVTGVEVGQRVAALTMTHGGGYGEVAVTDANLVVPVPENLSTAEAAVIPSNTTTALLVLDAVARLREGESVLVHAAAGGVGTQLGQVARLLGAGRVVGTVGSAAKIEVARRSGYHEVLVREDFLRTAPRDEFDVVVDPVGGAVRRPGLDALRMGGRLIAMGNVSGGADVAFDANELWFSGKGVLGFNLGGLSASRPQEVGPALRRAVAEVAAGRIRVELTGEFPAAQAAQAHRELESGASTGKFVLHH